jgi:rubrerythrin
MYKCRHCDSEIEYMHYRAYCEATEYGSVSIENVTSDGTIEDSGDHESNDRSDDTFEIDRYTCPECSAELRTGDLLIIEENNETTKNETNSIIKSLIESGQITEEEIEKRIDRMITEPTEDEELTHKITAPKTNILSTDRPKDITRNVIICKKCGNLINTLDGIHETTTTECPLCGETNSINN